MIPCSERQHRQLVEEILQRQDEALSQLEQLGERVEAMIAEVTTGRVGTPSQEQTPSGYAGGHIVIS